MSTTEEGVGLSQIFGSPPINGKSAFEVVDEQRRAEHQSAAQQHNGNQEPPDLDQSRINHGQQRRRTGRRVHSLGEGHDGRSGGTGEGTAEPFDFFKVVAEEEELSHAASDDGGEDLAHDGISRLGEGRFDGVELEHSGSTLDAQLVGYAFETHDESDAYKTAHDVGHVVRRKRVYMFADGLNHGNGTKDAQKGPEDGHQVARIRGLRLAVSKPVRHGVRDVFPWRRRDEWVEEPVDVEVPAVVNRHDGRL